MKLSKKANTAIIAIFFGTFLVMIFAFTYFVMTKPIQEVHDRVSPDIDVEHLPTFNKIKSAWDKWPLVGIFMVLLMMIVWVAKSRAPGGSQF